MMIYKTLKDVHLKEKKVIVRVDFNVPVDNGKITDTTRIDESLNTINYLLNQNCKIILLSHFGRIEKEEDKKKYSLKIVADYLKTIFHDNFHFSPLTFDQQIKTLVENLKPKNILLLENTRFEDIDGKKESKNNSELAQFWASLADVFVNDAFGTAHRAHASNVGIARYIKESCVGFLIEKEIKMLDKVLHSPTSPFIAILGGSKVSDKIAVIENLINKVDKIIIGGAMAYTFLKSKQVEVGNSRVEEDKLAYAGELLKNHPDKIVLPIDHICANFFEDKISLVTKNEAIPDNNMGLDIGTKTIKLFSDIIKSSKTIVWNGPMGVFEFENFAEGTKKVCEAIANNSNCFSLIGGGDSAAAAIQFGFEKKFTHISTGGGASLEYLEGKSLPGIECIQKK